MAILQQIADAPNASGSGVAAFMDVTRRGLEGGAGKGKRRIGVRLPVVLTIFTPGLLD